MASCSSLVSRTGSKLWAIMRLRDAGADTEVLKVNYCTRVRSIIEYGGAVWGCLISGTQAKYVEKVQIQALQIILGAQSSSYEANLVRLGLERLTIRRKEQITKFAISTIRDPNHSWWYTPSPITPCNSRNAPSLYKTPRLMVPNYRTERSEKMPLAVYSTILNSLSDQEWFELNLPSTSVIASRQRQNFQLSRIYSDKSQTIN